MANVLVFAEVRGGELRKVAFEAVTAARQLADLSGGGSVHAVLAGVACHVEQHINFVSIYALSQLRDIECPHLDPMFCTRTGQCGLLIV